MSKEANREFKKFKKIKSLQFKYEINGDGSILRNVKSKRRISQFKKSYNSKTEYWCAQINHGQSNIKKYFIHNLVAECWLGDKPEGYQTDHIDRNSLNNDYRNLRYVTKSEQMLNRDYEAFLPTILKNLAIKNKGVLLEITLSKGDFKKVFPTSRRAAKYLAEYYGETSEKKFQDKLHHRRKHIFDFEVEYRPYYLNEETKHGNPKG